MLHAIMHPDAVYRYSIWAVGLSLAACGVGAALLMEVAVGCVLPARVRRRHNALTAAILSVVGLTFGVLLAFVAMLAWEKYDAAKVATGREAAILIEIHEIAGALPDPERADLRASLADYAQAVRAVEWPAQAEGRSSRAGDPPLDRAAGVVLGLQSPAVEHGNIQAALIAGLTRLREAREDRRTAAGSHIPAIVWFVVVVGGAVTLICAALLGTSSLRLHLAMTSLLSVSGILVLVMIIALGHPFQGDLRITPEPFAAAEIEMGGR